MKLLLILILSSLYYFTFSTYKLDTIHKSKDIIWGLDFFDNQNIVYSEKNSGTLVFLDLVSKKSNTLKVKETIAKGQGGLLDVKIYKDHLYFTLSMKHKGILTTALAKGRILENRVKSYSIIFIAKVNSDTGRHFGSRIEIVNDAIFMTIGDRGERKFAQDLNYHNGKILKLDLNGNAFSSNPFQTKNIALKEIYSFGHRNPQGIVYQSNEKALYSVEFGPRGGDELNQIQAGKNYGWPVITYGKEYWGPSIGTTHKEGMEQPIVYWTPSISPSGMSFYIGNKIPEFKNQLFIAALGSQHIRRLILKNGKVVKQFPMFSDLKERFRQVRNSPDGFLYFTTDSGKIFKLIKN